MNITQFLIPVFQGNKSVLTYFSGENFGMEFGISCSKRNIHLAERRNFLNNEITKNNILGVRMISPKIWILFYSERSTCCASPFSVSAAG